jgi:phage-related minor tail protein
MSRNQKAGQKHSMKIVNRSFEDVNRSFKNVNKSFEDVAKFKYLETKMTSKFHARRY